MVSAKKEVTPKLLRLFIVWLVLVVGFLAWHDGLPRQASPDEWSAFIRFQVSVLEPGFDPGQPGPVYVLIPGSAQSSVTHWQQAVYPLFIPWNQSSSNLTVLRFRNTRDLVRLTSGVILPPHVVHRGSTLHDLLGRGRVWELKIPRDLAEKVVCASGHRR